MSFSRISGSSKLSTMRIWETPTEANTCITGANFMAWKRWVNPVDYFGMVFTIFTHLHHLGFSGLANATFSQREPILGSRHFQNPIDRGSRNSANLRVAADTSPIDGWLKGLGHNRHVVEDIGIDRKYPGHNDWWNWICANRYRRCYEKAESLQL